MHSKLGNRKLFNVQHIRYNHPKPMQWCNRWRDSISSLKSAPNGRSLYCTGNRCGRFVRWEWRQMHSQRQWLKITGSLHTNCHRFRFEPHCVQRKIERECLFRMKIRFIFRFVEKFCCHLKSFTEMKDKTIVMVTLCPCSYFPFSMVLHRHVEILMRVLHETIAANEMYNICLK